MAARRHTLPPLLDVAAHPLRWALLCELARTDARVRELAALVDERQSLVSYHLGRLRSSGLVATRRSSFDGRDTYYRADVPRCGALFAETGAALHPALRLAAPPAPARAGETGMGGGRAPRADADRVRVLFLCTGNSARSQMAEALLRHTAPDWTEAFSAGSRPKDVHPEAIRAMRERGIDIADARSRHLSVFASDRFDHVVSLCDRVREVCPEFPGRPETAHWSVPDPAAEPDPDVAFARTADELAERIRFFVHVLALRPTTPERN
jgi:ArsR family transcriptional regulator, arsenate/arsenite/antimonite-responsive transcriptional repressor / arsenate reductase (thioredoxin)